MTMSFYVPVCIVIVFFLHSANAAPNPELGKTSDFTTRIPYQFLQPQNAARAVLGMPPLKWDTKLAAYARWWASQRKYDCALEHSNGPYGENIFWGSGTGWYPAQAVAAWVSERKWYNYWRNTCAGGQMCGHYTQIVWKSTTRVGCATIICFNGGGTFMVCNYDPPGNYIGERPY